MRHGNQIATERKDDRDAGQDLDTFAVETPAKELGQCSGATAPQVTAEEQSAQHIADRSGLREQYVRPTLGVVREARLAEEHRRTHQARDQRAYDNQRRSAATGNIVVVELLYASPGVVSYRDIDNDADRNRCRIDVH